MPNQYWSKAEREEWKRANNEAVANHGLGTKGVFEVPAGEFASILATFDALEGLARDSHEQLHLDERGEPSLDGCNGCALLTELK